MFYHVPAYFCYANRNIECKVNNVQLELVNILGKKMLFHFPAKRIDNTLI